MHNLLDFLRKYCHVLLFVALECIGLTLLCRFNGFQGSVWLTAANDAAAGVQSLNTEVTSFFELRNVNRTLTHQNVHLFRENAKLREELASLKKDTTLTEKLMAEKLKDFRLIEAMVVSNTTGGGENYLVINRGEADGVKPEMGVVGGGGAVGIVYLTDVHHSLVIPLTNRKSSISCRVRGQNYFGYLQWSGGSTRHAVLDDVPRYAKVKSGDVVETSGYSAVFPPGIFVGRVKSVDNSSDGQSYKLDVALGTNFSNIRDVQVISTPYKAELDSLFSKAAKETL